VEGPKTKAEGKHGGALGGSALRVLETFLDGWLISNLVTNLTDYGPAG
jgi:hypothetical protein